MCVLSTTTELMDRGTYTTLMEDWCYMTGNEEEKLKEFNDRMLSAFSEGIADGQFTYCCGVIYPVHITLHIILISRCINK